MVLYLAFETKVIDKSSFIFPKNQFCLITFCFGSKSKFLGPIDFRIFSRPAEGRLRPTSYNINQGYRLQSEFGVWDKNGRSLKCEYNKVIWQSKFGVWDKDSLSLKNKYYKVIQQSKFGVWDKSGRTLKYECYKIIWQSGFGVWD